MLIDWRDKVNGWSMLKHVSEDQSVLYSLMCFVCSVFTTINKKVVYFCVEQDEKCSYKSRINRATFLSFSVKFDLKREVIARIEQPRLRKRI